MKTEPPDSWCFWLFNESLIPLAHISKSNHVQWADLHMWLDMNKIKNLRASWLFLQLENNADFVMFFFLIYVIFHKEIKSTKKSKKNLLNFMHNKNILLLLCWLFSEAK